MADYYPPVAFSFAVSIAGTSTGIDAGFSEVSGLNAEVELNEVIEGGENRFVHKLPGRVKNTNIVLKRGQMVATSPLFKWCKETLEGGLAKPIKPQTVVVSLLDQTQKPMLAWSLDRAWPVKWQVAEFKANGNDLAIETMELAYAAVTRKLMRTKPKTGLLKP
ncbi:phage tail protein [uncultured Litoreibacter sp.]|uniref:phage tail protein n=1 Tax=uncultured Litoreibacter sp. TaxID=1392394 RepID=UPI00262549E5|nr:phage tail protein [uncultured Litoreibacter sp.]